MFSWLVLFETYWTILDHALQDDCSSCQDSSEPCLTLKCSYSRFEGWVKDRKRDIRISCLLSTFKLIFNRNWPRDADTSAWCKLLPAMNLLHRLYRWFQGCPGMPRCIAFARDVSSSWGDTDPLVKVRTGWIVSEDVVLGWRKPKVTGPIHSSAIGQPFCPWRRHEAPKFSEVADAMMTMFVSLCFILAQ